MNTKQKAKGAGSRPVGRIAYVSPKLKYFGPVGALTQSGSGMMTENGMIDMMTGELVCMTNTMRNMC